MKESSLEKSIKDYVKRCGGRAFKWVSPGAPGVPDRICIFPGGKIVFVELKRPGLKDGRSLRQKKIMGILKNLGCTVWLINSKELFISKLTALGVFPLEV